MQRSRFWPEELVVRDDPTGSGTVLVVDDAGAVRQATKWMLEYYGYSVLTAENAEIALQYVDDTAIEIDLVITDIRLPDMSASALVQALQRRKPEIKILLVSAFDRERLDESLTKFEFIPKPIQFATIGESVKRILSATCPAPALRPAIAPCSGS